MCVMNSISFLDCTIKNLRLWPAYPAFDKYAFNPTGNKNWEIEQETSSTAVRYKPFDSSSKTTFHNTFTQNFHNQKVYICKIWFTNNSRL